MGALDSRHVLFVPLLAALALGCGQDEVTFPECDNAGGVCGPAYPGGAAEADAGVDGGAEIEYAVEPDAIFPCAVWESARLNGQDIYVDASQVYLDAKHGLSDTRSLVIIVSARNCQSCLVLINAIAPRADEFDDAGAYMIMMARKDQYDLDGPDLTLDEAYAVAEHDSWPVERWPVINGEEYFLSTEFDDIAPWFVIVGVKDMVVRVKDPYAFTTDANGVSDLLDYLNSAEFD